MVDKVFAACRCIAGHYRGDSCGNLLDKACSVAEKGIGNPVVGEFSIGSLISSIIGILIIFAFIISFFFLLWGGFAWISSGGDEAGLTAARQRIIHALIGLILVVGAWVIFTFLIGPFFGIDFTDFTLPTLGGE